MIPFFNEIKAKRYIYLVHTSVRKQLFELFKLVKGNSINLWSCPEDAEDRN